MSYKININVLNINSSNALSTIKTNYYKNFNDTINDFNNNVVNKCSFIRTFNITSLVLKIYNKEKENLEMLNNLIKIINDGMESYDIIEQEKIEIENPNLNSVQVLSNDMSMSSIIVSNDIMSNLNSKLTVPVLGTSLGTFTLNRSEELALAAQNALSLDQSGANYQLGNLPWCAHFVTQLIEENGLGDEIGIKNIPNTNMAYGYKNYFQSIDKFVTDKDYVPKPGDLIIYSKYEHIGIVSEITDDYIYTIEGNTTMGGSSYQINQCRVARNDTVQGTYNNNDVYGYCVWE